MLWILFLSISGISALLRKFEVLAGLASFVGFGYLIGTPNFLYNGDANVYLYNYVYGTNNFERGYNWLANMFEGKVEYKVFRLESSIVLYLLIFFSILIFTRHTSIVAFGYGLAMFPFDNEQVRNAMAALFVLVGVAFLVKKGNKGIPVSILIICIGSLFHSLALFFIILPILWLVRGWIRRHFKVLFSVASLISLGFQIVGSTGVVPIISDLLARVSTRESAAENVSTIYSGTMLPLKHWLVFYAVTCLVLVTGWFVGKSIDYKNVQYFDLFLCSMLMWTLALMLVTISIDYVRIFRLVMFFYLIMIAKRFSEINIKQSAVLTLTVFVPSLSVMILQFWSYGMDAMTIKSIFGFI